MDPGVEKLAKKVVNALRSGPLVHFTCSPGGAYPGETVELTATFYVTSVTRLSKLKPIVRGVEVPIEAALAQEAGVDPQRAIFRGELEVGDFSVAQGVLTLGLHPQPDAKAVASAKLYVLSRAEAAVLRSSLTP